MLSIFAPWLTLPFHATNLARSLASPVTREDSQGVARQYPSSLVPWHAGQLARNFMAPFLAPARFQEAYCDTFNEVFYGTKKDAT